MGPSELEELLYEGRPYPVRLTLSSGDQIVEQPDDQRIVEGLTLDVPARPRNARVTGEPRLVSLSNIALAEVIEFRPSGSSSRRRR